MEHPKLGLPASQPLARLAQHRLALRPAHVSGGDFGAQDAARVVRRQSGPTKTPTRNFRQALLVFVCQSRSLLAQSVSAVRT